MGGEIDGGPINGVRCQWEGSMRGGLMGEGGCQLGEGDRWGGMLMGGGGNTIRGKGTLT